jgi:class 3 adenylate cyclase/tetratricopeptide (TPR) repeat protein
MAAEVGRMALAATTSADALAGFIPRYLSGRLASGPPITGPECTVVRGAVLLLDIAGFTAQVERLAGTGDEGLEEVAAAFNAHFIEIVDVVYAHGGDVLSIAGDAFFCHWPADESGGLPNAIVRAAQAGLAIQAALSGHVKGASHRFSARIGIGAGDLTIALVGGVGGNWQVVTAGPPVDEVANAERDAPLGRVAISSATLALVPGRCETVPVSEGLEELRAVREGLPVSPTAPRQATTEDAIRTFVPAALAELGPFGGTDWLAELRRVTVLIARPPPGAQSDFIASTHQTVRIFQEIISRFEGTMRVSVDNKGVTIVCTFGLPPMAHENDAERGILAAEALLDGLGEHAGRTSIGIANGRAFCGVFGGDVRRDYTLHGDVINLAARLMQAQDGEILCDDATAQVVHDRFAFEVRRPIIVKGRTELIRTYRPSQRLRSVSRAPVTVVGRTAERARLTELLDALARRDSSLLILEGEAGIGKSWLVNDTVQRAERGDARVLLSAGDPLERQSPYAPWRPAFLSLFDIGDDPTSAAARARVASRLRDHPELERLAPLLNSVLPLQLPETELTAAMTGEVRAENTRALLTGLLRLEAQAAATLLVVEDAHWFDSSSWGLLLEVVQSVHPLVVLVTTRPVADSAVELARLRALASAHLHLHGLSEPEIETLLRDRLGVPRVPTELVRFVQGRVSGNPFFCKELIQTMVEAGLVTMSGTTCSVGDLTSVEIPATVEGVVLSRLDRLTPAQQLCIKVAAVIGRSFRAGTVRDLYPVPEERDHVHAHLAALALLDLTTHDADEPDGMFRFRHEITRDVTYQLMTVAQRQPLHRAAAEWYEEHHADDLSPYYGILAYHWERAGDPAKTLGYLERAGRQALRDGAFREALSFLSSAVELYEGADVAPDPVARALCDKGIAVAHYFLGDLARSREYLERAVAVLDRPVPAGRRLGLAGLGAVLQQVAHLVAPRRYRGRRAAEGETLGEAVDSYRILAQISYLDAEPASRLLYLTVTGLNLAELVGPSTQLACLLMSVGTVASLVGFHRRGNRYAAQALEMAQTEGIYDAGPFVWSIYAIKQAQVGQWQALAEANDRALKLVYEVADYNLEAEVWQTRAAAYLCQGDYDAAETAWRHTRQLAEQTGNPQMRCWSLLDEVETRLGQDRTAEAAEVLEEALAIPTAASDGSSTLEKLVATAVTRVRQGRDGDAVAAADALLEIVGTDPPTGFHQVDFAAGALEVYLDVLDSGDEYAQTHRAELLGRARRGTRALRRMARTFPFVRPRRELARARLRRAQGRPRAAARAARRAEAIALDLDVPFDRARALAEQAREPSGAEQTTRLETAAAIFAERGATYELGRTRAGVRTGRG